MKKLVLFVLTIITSSVYAQNYVTIPDANFAKYLKEVVPNAINGDQLDTSNLEVKNLKYMDAEARAIKNLEGVQYFTGLETLDVGNGDIIPLPAKNQFSTLPILPENLKVLICGNTALDSLPTLPKQLLILECYGNNLTKLPSLPNTLEILYCNFNRIKSLTNLSKNLIKLYCSNNEIEGILNLENTQLIEVFAPVNKISTVSNIPSTLLSANFSVNLLDSLPILPNKIKILEADRNNLSYVPNLPISLKVLNLEINKITSLPKLPDSLYTLNVSNNLLEQLPVLPDRITDLNCQSNKLTSLPEIPSSLSYLRCGYNLLNSLPLLNNTKVDIIECNNNNITFIPSLNEGLGKLDCSYNKISELPILNSELRILLCNNNNLTELPILPFYLEKLNCSSNNISCLPILPNSLTNSQSSVFTNLYYYYDNSDTFSNWQHDNWESGLIFSNNQITCLPNYINAMDNNTLSYPLCDKNDNINNPHGCPDAKKGILGFTSFDTNKNCHKDSLETSLANIPMVLLDSANNLVSQTYTAINGVYQFPVGANNYTVQIDTTNLPFSALCPKGGDTTIVLSDSSIFAKDVNFNLTCKEGFDVGIRSIATSGIVFPGQPHNLYVAAGDMSNWFGKNCAQGISGQLQLTVTGPVKYVATTGTKTPSINGNVYTYEIADFGNVNFSEDFGLSFVTDTTAKADAQICVNAQITPKNGDYNVTNNTYDFCYSVINSHDPNLKEVYPANFKPGYEGYFTYTIHFQNTGNAPAFNIRLLDTLDKAFDLTTFEVLNYSHANRVSLNGNIMNVYFKNIQLQDSTTNEKESHGFIQYRIKPKKAVSESDQIKNTAHIYFDFNEAVVTNTTVSKTNEGLGIHEEKEIGLRVYPNPTENLLTFERTSHAINTVNVSILSVNGQVLFTNKLDLSNKQTVDLSDFSPGVYFVNVQNENATDVIKVIKK